MKIAVFDVCGTLYDSNTTFEFLDYYLKNNKKYQLYRWFVNSYLGRAINFLLYKFFKQDITRRIATSYLKGISQEALKSASKIFVYKQLEKDIKIDIHELLDEYRDKGFKILLMSGSYSIIVEHVCSYFHADGFFASELEVINSKYTGRYKSDQLYNKKEILLEKYPAIAELVVVSDNKTDFELMREADKGYAICNKHKQVVFWESRRLSNVKIVS